MVTRMGRRRDEGGSPRIMATEIVSMGSRVGAAREGKVVALAVGVTVLATDIKQGDDA